MAIGSLQGMTLPKRPEFPESLGGYPYANQRTAKPPVVIVTGSDGRAGTITFPAAFSFTTGATASFTGAKLYYRGRTHWRKITAGSKSIVNGSLQVAFTVGGAKIASNLALSLDLPAGAVIEGSNSSPVFTAVSARNQSTRIVWDVQYIDAAPAFRGNPNRRAITAIDTSGGITFGRSTILEGQAIHASASAITATGSSAPYRDLEFSWLCEVGKVGVASPDINTDSDWYSPTALVDGIDSFTRPTTGGSLNPYTDQTGGEFCIPADFPRNYRLTLSVRGSNGSGFTTVSVKGVVTVTAFGEANNQWFDSVSGSSGNDGNDPWGFVLPSASYRASDGVIIASSGSPFDVYDQIAATAPKLAYNQSNRIYLSNGSIDFTPPVAPVYWIKPEDLPAQGQNLTTANIVNRGTGAAPTVSGTVTVGAAIGGGFRAIPVDGTNGIDFPTFAYTDATVLAIITGSNGRNLAAHANSNTDGSWLLSVNTTSVSAFVDADGVVVVAAGTGYGDSITETTTATNPFIAGLTITQTTVAAHSNGLTNSKATATAFRHATGTIRLGLAAGYSVGEFVILPAASDPDRQKWEGYLYWKFGIQAKLPGGHPYASAPPYALFTGKYTISGKTSGRIISIASGPASDISIVAPSTGPKAAPGNMLGASLTRVRLKNGSTFAGAMSNYSASISVDVSNFWTHGYGSGASAIAQNGCIGNSGASSKNITGAVAQDLDCDAGGVARSVSMTGDSLPATSQFNWGMLRNVRIRNNPTTSANGSVSVGTPSYDPGSSLTGSGAVLWNCDLDGTQSTGAGLRSIGAALGFWSAMVGCVFAVQANDSIFSHYVYPHPFFHGLRDCLKFGEGGDSANYCLNEDAGVSTVKTPARYRWTRNVQFANANYGSDSSGTNLVRHEDGGNSNPFQDVVYEDCSFHHMQCGLFYFTTDDLCVRNSYFWIMSSYPIQNADTAGRLEAYGNKCYRETTDTAQTAFIVISNVANVKAHQITNNIVQDLRALPTFLEVSFTSFATSVAAGAVVFGNKIYAPNDSSGGKFFKNRDDSTYHTAAEFESSVGLSAGTLTVLGAAPFNAPATGDFSGALIPPVFPPSNTATPALSGASLSESPL